MNQTSERARNVAESIDAAVQQYCEEREAFDTSTKGDGFAIWCLTDVFGFERDDAIDALTGAKGDHSMDAIADDGNRLIVLQAKYHSHDWAEVTKFQTDARSVGAGTARLPQALRAPATKIRARQESGLPIEYFYITNDRFTGDDVVKISNLGDEPELSVLDLDGICDLLFERESQRPVNVPAQPVVLHPRISPLQFGDSLVFPVPLREFSRFVSEDGKDRWLFNSNVRQYLSRSKINEGIRETARNSPSSFWRYNNGVTIVVDEFEVRKNSLALTKPQIVNGCQTSLALVKVMAEMTPSEQEKVDGDLLVRVIREPRDEERERITQFTNKQNAVKGKDFYALQDFQKQLKTRIGRLGYFYEIQTGSYDMLSRSAKEGLRGESRFSHLQWKRKDYRVPAIEAAKCHAAAFRSKVAACYANPADFTPNGDLYDTVFPADLPLEPEMFLLPFLLMKHAESALGYGASKGAAWRRRGRYVFVYSAFKTLREALIQADRATVGVDLGNATVREVFADESITHLLVGVTEKVMESFFTDTPIQKLINSDIFAFLKRTIEGEDATTILDSKIRYQLTDNDDGRTLVAALRAALPA